MIYIVTALYCEAHPLISQFQLKKESGTGHLQVFSNEQEGILLVVTGVGMIPAAVAVGSICTACHAGAGDFLLNIGTCAAFSKEAFVGEKAGQSSCEIFLCNKITDATTGRTYYPDLLYRSACREAEIVTGATVFAAAQDGAVVPGAAVTSGGAVAPSGAVAPGAAVALSGAEEFSAARSSVCLYDMEAAAVYQAGACFFAPHQMTFLKIISDAGDADSVTPELAETAVSANMKEICSYIELLKRAGCGESAAERDGSGKCVDFPAERDGSGKCEDAERLCSDLHCSAVMRASLFQHLRYCRLAGIDAGAVIGEMYAQGILPCKDKREGKKRFEELKSRLL